MAIDRRMCCRWRVRGSWFSTISRRTEPHPSTPSITGRTSSSITIWWFTWKLERNASGSPSTSFVKVS
jgi:hypothetical protein